MITYALVVIVAAAVLYFWSKHKPVFLFALGAGFGLLIGGIWAAIIINTVFP